MGKKTIKKMKKKTKKNKKKKRIAQRFTVDLHSETLNNFSFFLIYIYIYSLEIRASRMHVVSPAISGNWLLCFSSSTVRHIRWIMLSTNPSSP